MKGLKSISILILAGLLLSCSSGNYVKEQVVIMYKDIERVDRGYNFFLQHGQIGAYEAAYLPFNAKCRKSIIGDTKLESFFNSIIEDLKSDKNLDLKSLNYSAIPTRELIEEKLDIQLPRTPVYIK